MMQSKKILLVDNSNKHISILKGLLTDFDVQSIQVNGNDVGILALDIEQRLQEGGKFLLLIDVWLTEQEETNQGPSYSGVELALEIYQKYKDKYGSCFVISLLTAYDLDFVIDNVEKFLNDKKVKIPFETNFESFKNDKKQINLPFYVIKKPIYQNTLRTDFYPASLYENLTGIVEFDYSKAMRNIIAKRLEMLN